MPDELSKIIEELKGLISDSAKSPRQSPLRGRLSDFVVNNSDPLLTSLSELEALRKRCEALQSEADYHRAQIKHNPDEPKWKGRDVAEHLAAKSDAASAALTTSERGETEVVELPKCPSCGTDGPCECP